VDGFGSAADGVGDLDGDGLDDFLVGAPYDDTGPAFDAGLVVLYSGATGAPIASLRGTAQSEQFGGRIVGLPDLDGDGLREFAVSGSGGMNNGGYVGVFSGATLTGMLLLHGDAAFDGYGASVASPGDVSGDGIADLLIGAPFTDVNATDAGSAYLHSGVGGARLLTFRGSSLEESFGQAVGGEIGDFDGDLVPDLLVGAPGNDGGRPDAGMVRMFSGATGGAIGSVFGESQLEQLGTSITALADGDGDGRPDFALGSPFSLATSDGRVLVYSSARDAFLPAFFSAETNSLYGGALASGGDLDGDGLTDLLVGAAGSDFADPDAGRVFAYSMAGPALSLLTPGLAGQVNSTMVSGATPLADVYVLSSLQPGLTPVPDCAGLSVEMSNATINGPVAADASGAAAFSGFVPPGLSGRTLLLQAVEHGACSISALLATTFP
jgi:hypothetical protein